MSSPELIDQAVFTRLFESLGGDVEFLNELVGAYLDSSPELFSTMQLAIASGEAPALQRAAHSLKTGSASFGAMAFAAQCKELEDLGKVGALTQAGEKYSALKLAYSEVVEALQVELKKARSAAS